MNRKAFALVELLTVMGIIAILFSLSVPQLFRLRNRNNLQTSTTKLISLIRQQQINAMNSSQMYGIYFEQTQYTQFSGSKFVNNNSANSITLLEFPVEISHINIPASTLIFASGSGEIVGFDATRHSVVLEEMVNHEQNTIQLNSLGVPTSL